MYAFKYFVLSWIIGLILGFQIIEDLNIHLLVLFALPLIASLLLFLRSFDSRRFYVGTALIIIAGLSSGILHQTVWNSDGNILDLKGDVLGKVIVSKLWGKTEQIVVRTQYGKVLLRKSNSIPPKLKQGDWVSFSPQFKELKQSKGLSDFDEAGYWRAYGVRYYSWTGKYNSLTAVDTTQSRVGEIVHELRSGMNTQLSKMDLSLTNRAILLAMITGDKSALEKDQKAMFSQLGIMHLLAVSGLHLGLVYVVISQILSLVGFQPHSPFNRLISVVLVWIYGLMCGLPPSAIRAASMLTVYHIGRIFNRHIPGHYVVFLVAFIHSMISPTSVFSAGFQLSYLAVLGIFVYFPKIINLFKTKNKILVRIRDLLAMSLSAQAFTWPLSVKLFAVFPVWFLLSNLLLMPAGILIFYLGLGLTFFRTLGINISLMEKILDKIMDIWILLGQLISHLPGGLLKFDTFPFKLLTIYVLLLWLSKNGLKHCVNKPQSILILFMFWSFYSFFNTFVAN